MIRLENLTKHYGSFVAVDDISLEVPQGLLYGCLGPNGAGKTTMLRMIAGILRPTDGRVLLGGDDVHRNAIAAKLKLGFIPDRPFVYDKLTGAEFLRFVAGLDRESTHLKSHHRQISYARFFFKKKKKKKRNPRYNSMHSETAVIYISY